MQGLSGLYTIPRGHNFLCELARGLLQIADPDKPEQLSQTTVYLPNRRAVRNLRDQFLQQAESRALLLPKMIAVGDIDTEELLASGLATTLADLPTLINGLERQWQLSEFLCKRDGNLSRAQALRQACELASLLDQLQTYEKTEQDLQQIVSEGNLAEHWQSTLDFLNVINHAWPGYLNATGQLDPAMQRNALLRAQADHWRRANPDRQIIIAGNISAQVGKLDPATLDLMQAALGLPKGAILLPSFDRLLSAQDWAELDPVHPDYLVRDMLEQLAATRSMVSLWPTITEQNRPRELWLREAMRPAESTVAWRHLRNNPLPSAVVDDISLISCATEQEEAQSIALIIREALDTPEQTVSLVTPDRHLSRLVIGQLRRWNIVVDDSAGVPLTRTSLGMYLQLVVAACQPRASLFDGLALGKSPYLSMGMSEGEAHALFRDLERLVLRQTFIGPTLAAWQRALKDDTIRIESDARNRLMDFYERWLAILQPLRDLLARPDQDIALDAMLDAHLSVVENLSATHQSSGADLLWQGAEGNCAANCFFKIRDTLGDRKVRAGDYADLLKVWLEPENVRSPYESHPRVTIYGLIESRLQQSDIVILGSLNEGTWPELPPVNPFLSRRMMKDLDLPDPESKIGQGAHDFMNAITAKKVYLTRAERVQNTPTVPARWLLRMNAVLTDPALVQDWQRSGQQWTQLAQLLDRPVQAIKPISPPAPTPPRSARPRQLSVTQIEQWLRDPYGLYARKILSLNRLQKLQTLPTDAQRGQLVHAMLEGFARETLNKARLAPSDYTLLLQLGQAELRRYADQPDIYALWQSYLDIVAKWFYEQEEKERAESVPVATETKGEVQFLFNDVPFTLTARADRVDRMLSGELSLLDYKTGTAPTVKQMERGYAAQLALEALLVNEGGFASLGAATAKVAYWQLPSREDKGDIVIVKDDKLQQIIDSSRAALENLVNAFDNDVTPYLPTPLPDRTPRYNDYLHLERTLEWAFADSADDAGEVSYG